MSQSSIILYDVLASSGILEPEKFHEFSRICAKVVFQSSNTASSVIDENAYKIALGEYYVEGRNYYFDLFDYKFLKKNSALDPLFQYFTIVNCPHTLSYMLQCNPKTYKSQKSLPDLDISIITPLLSTYALSYYMKFSGQFDNYFVIVRHLQDTWKSVVVAIKEAPIKSPERFYLKALCDLLGENEYMLANEATERLNLEVKDMSDAFAKEKELKRPSSLHWANFDGYFAKYLESANGKNLKNWFTLVGKRYANYFRDNEELLDYEKIITDRSKWSNAKINIVNLIKNDSKLLSFEAAPKDLFYRLWAIHEFININLPKDIYRITIAVNNLDNFFNGLSSWLNSLADNETTITPEVLFKYGIKDLLTCKTDTAKLSDGTWRAFLMVKLWGFIEFQIFLVNIPVLADHRLYEIRRVQQDTLKLAQLSSDNTKFNKVLIHCKDVAYKSIMDQGK